MLTFRHPLGVRDLIAQAEVPLFLTLLVLISNRVLQGVFPGALLAENMSRSGIPSKAAIRAIYMTKGHITCTTTNLICLMSCKVCGVPCIGERRTTLKRQFHDQGSTDNTCKSDTPVGHHFGLPNHSIPDTILQGIEPLGTTESLSISVERRCWSSVLAPFNPWSEHPGQWDSWGHHQWLVSSEQTRRNACWTLLHVCLGSGGCWYIDNVFFIWTNNEESLTAPIHMNSFQPGKRTGLARELAWQENWLGKRTGLARELAWQENWLGKRTGLARELAWQENFGKRTGLARELAWQENGLGKRFGLANCF